MTVGIQVHVGVRGATAEKVHRAALAYQLDGLLPGFGQAHGFNRDVDAATVRRERARLLDRLADGGSLNDMRGAELPCRLNLAVVLDDGDDLVAGQRGDMQDHQAQRTAADHGDMSPLRGSESSNPWTAQASGSVSAACSSGTLSGNKQRVLGDDARRNLDELGVGAVVEEQIVAKVLLPARAEVALAARRGVERHHAVARQQNP